MAGRLHVDQVLAELSGDELAEWQAYYALEPWGDEWKRTALVAMLIAETHRNPDEREEPFELDEFMPRFESSEDERGDETEETEEEPAWMRWKAAFAAIAEAQK
jgi:hypothetical protein